MHKAAESWAATTRRIGCPVAGESFPEKVEYPHRCRCICERDMDAHTKAMGLLAMFSRAASHCKSPKDVPGSDMMLMVTAERPSAEHTHVSYWWMTGASFKSGNHAATQTFMMCCEAGTTIGPAGPRVHLRVERESIVTMDGRAKSPFQQQAAAPAIYSEEAAARMILLGGAGAGSAIELPSEVTFDKLLLVEQHADAVLAAGKDAEFAQLRLTTTLAAAADAAAKAKAKAKPDPKPKAKPDLPDFLSLAYEQNRPAVPPEKAARTDAVGPSAGTSSAGSARGRSAEQARKAAQSLADALGLSLGAIQEDPSGDAAFTNGLVEVVGDDVAKLLRGVRIALEEDEEKEADEEKAAYEQDDDLDATPGAASSSAGAATVSAPGESAGSAGAAASSAGSAGAASSSGPSSGAAAGSALMEKRVESIHGLEVEYTGFTSGLSMRVRRPDDGEEIGLIHRINPEFPDSNLQDSQRAFLFLLGDPAGPAPARTRGGAGGMVCTCYARGYRG